MPVTLGYWKIRGVCVELNIVFLYIRTVFCIYMAQLAGTAN